MISLISHSDSSLSSFKCAVPTCLSLLKKHLGRGKPCQENKLFVYNYGGAKQQVITPCSFRIPHNDYAYSTNEFIPLKLRVAGLPCSGELLFSVFIHLYFPKRHSKQL